MPHLVAEAELTCPTLQRSYSTGTQRYLSGRGQVPAQMNQPLSGLRRDRMTRLEEFLSSGGYGTPIDAPRGKSLGLLSHAVLVGAALCWHENQTYFALKPEVFFVPLDAKKRFNAYAFWMQRFNVVAVTAPLLRDLAHFSHAVAAIALTGFDGRLHEDIRALCLPHGSARRALGRMMLDSALSFLIGHELGHIRGGHDGVFGVMATGAGESTPIVDDFASAAAASAGDDRPTSLERNAHEMDADFQAIPILNKHFANQLQQCAETAPSTAQARLRCALLTDGSHSMFIKSIGVVIALGSLGFISFDKTWNERPTHPLTALRVVSSLRALAHGTPDPTKDLPAECADALRIVSFTMAEALVRADSYDSQASPFSALLSRIPRNAWADHVLHQTGLAAVLTKTAEVTEHYRRLQTAFIESARRRHALVPADRLLRWT